jgi:hypothetical protein
MGDLFAIRNELATDGLGITHARVLVSGLILVLARLLVLLRLRHDNGWRGQQEKHRKQHSETDFHVFSH